MREGLGTWVQLVRAPGSLGSGAREAEKSFKHGVVPLVRTPGWSQRLPSPLPGVVGPPEDSSLFACALLFLLSHGSVKSSMLELF